VDLRIRPSRRMESHVDEHRGLDLCDVDLENVVRNPGRLEPSRGLKPLRDPAGSPRGRT
jgi:hypothetical protein